MEDIANYFVTPQGIPLRFRPGVLLTRNHDAAWIMPSATATCSQLKAAINTDWLITVTDIGKGHEARITLAAPTAISLFDSLDEEGNDTEITNKLSPTFDDERGGLVLTRPAYSSIIIRRSDDISTECAIQDLQQNGICVINHSWHSKSGLPSDTVKLKIEAHKAIWKIIRLEIGELRIG